MYELAAGKYLPQSSETPIDCNQSGYYCPGDQNGVYYSTSGNQGLSQCPSGYSSSDTGASSEDDCYRACTVANANIAHASAVTGNDYYGNGTDTCAPTSCDPGYHVNTPTLITLIGTSEGVDHVTNNGTGTQGYSWSGMTSSDAGISGDPMAFALDYGENKGRIKGHGRCSTRSAADPWVDPSTNDGYALQSDGHPNSLPDSTGLYCYCRLDNYTPYGSNTAIALSGPWVFVEDYDSTGVCSNYCSSRCAEMLMNDGDDSRTFTPAMLGLYPYGSASCEANTITINWTDVDSETAGQNNEGTATYGGNINTPKAAETKPGQRFKGWRFSAPEQTNLSE